MPSVALLPRCHADALCRALRQADGGLLAVLLLGSGVYAPGLARDLDLLLVTAAPRRLSAYEGALRGLLPDLPAPDLLVRGPADAPGPLRLAVASARVLWRRPVEVPLLSAAAAAPGDFAEARGRMDIALALMATGACASGEFAARFAQEAFETLFAAARTAVMAFLASRVRRRLPLQLRRGFEPLAAACHIRYGCEARLPAGAAAVAAEFARWQGCASTLIAAAEQAAASPWRGRARAGAPVGGGVGRMGRAAR